MQHPVTPGQFQTHYIYMYVSDFGTFHS